MAPSTSNFEGEDAVTHHEKASRPPAPPPLTDKPTAYSGCCLALSTPLIAYVHSLLSSPPALTLSIGSGFGLLEAHLLAPPHSSNIVGVEIDPSPNRYLPALNHRAVHGTRFLEPLAREAATWLFVYPRRVGLIGEYIEAYGDAAVTGIVWIGPQADWEDYQVCFKSWHVQSRGADEVGGKAWELIAVAKRCV